jgi:hypothetical protein
LTISSKANEFMVGTPKPPQNFKQSRVVKQPDGRAALHPLVR